MIGFEGAAFGAKCEGQQKGKEPENIYMEPVGQESTKPKENDPEHIYMDIQQPGTQI